MKGDLDGLSRQISFVSLGCDKNTVDSEIMISLLAERGYALTKDDEKADVIIVNTCGFIQDAKEESIQTIIEMGGYKEVGACKALIVTGCLAQRYADEIFQEMPEVDAVVGTGSYESIVDVVDAVLSKKEEKLRCVEKIEGRDLSYHKRTITTPGYYEYLKIAEGCDNHCTYCIIPKLRGRYRSRRPEDILREAEDLARSGVVEVMIVAQDITKYGRDLPEPATLSGLLRQLCEIEELSWIRLLYCYPEDITDELIEIMAQEDKILPYIDMPIQHCSNSILRRMGRRHTKEILLERIQRLRQRIPEICIRTTLITGFPGETEDEFEEMCDFVREVRFDRLGVFAYSQEENTPAAEFADQIPEAEKQRRKEQLMEIQRSISEAKSNEFIGQKMKVLVEGQIPGEEGYVYSTRTYRDAPDIDGFLFLKATRSLLSGEVVDCEVTGASEYDLIGEMRDEDEYCE